MINFELCKIESSAAEAYVWDSARGYSTRIVNAESFHKYMHPDVSPGLSDWLFERGDICVANFYEDLIVGFGFNSRLSTRVNERIDFDFPQSYVYGFGDYTHPDHRGKRLARDRWKVLRETHNAEGSDPPTIFYVNLGNIESLRANLSTPEIISNRLIGYTAHIKIGDRSFCWNSAGTKAAGACFRLRKN